MRAAAKPALERAISRMKRNYRRASMRRPLPNGPATQFHRDPDREDGAPIWPADDSITPAALLFMKGEPFEIDGDSYHVERVIASKRGQQADLLVLRGREHMRCKERTTRRAIQVRDLEDLIDQDRVVVMFGVSARQWNLDRGWCRGGRTLASLGFDLRSISKPRA